MKFRTFVFAATVCCAAATGVNAQEITFAGGGGAAQEAQRKAFFDPTEKALGIKINEATANFLQEVRLQVQSGAVSWDIVEMGADDCAVGSKEGLWEPLDFSIVKTEGIDPKLVGKDWVGYFYYSTVLAWNSETFPNGLSGWADLFNVEKAPGERAIYNYPRGNLEIALLADGVPPDKLYPIDVDRAFKKLEELKPNVAVWWESGAQSAQLIKDGSVDMLEIWNGRVNSVIKDGGKAAYTFNQGILNADCIAIPKGSKNKDLAMKALAMFISPEIQARFPLYIDYGPINAKAFETGVLTPEQIKQNLGSPENLKSQVIADVDWWAENMAAMTEKWNNFRQQ